MIVTGVEMFQKTLDQGQAGDNVGALLRGVEREDVAAGAGAGASRARSTRTREFQAEVYVLGKEEGGGTRRSSPATGRSSTSGPPT